MRALPRTGRNVQNRSLRALVEATARVNFEHYGSREEHNVVQAVGSSITRSGFSTLPAGKQPSHRRSGSIELGIKGAKRQRR